MQVKPSGRRLLPVTAVIAASVAVLGLQVPGANAAATASPARPSAQLQGQATAAAARATPAWLAKIQERAVRYTRNGRSGPYGPNPSLAYVADPGRLDWGGWLRAQPKRKAPSAQARSLRGVAAAAAPRQVREVEPAGTRGRNDTFPTAQRLTTFGTRSGADRAVTVLGNQSPAARPALQAQPPNTEDDGDLPLARDTGVSQVRGGFTTTGTIGDAPPLPEQPVRDDADLYKVTLRAGELLEVTMAATSGTLEPLLIVVDATGNPVAFSFDPGKTINLAYTARAAGTYYVVATGWTIINVDTGEVIRPQGDYRIDIAARAGDRDLYAVTLQGGDVLGVNLRGRASYVSVFEPTGTEVHGSPGDPSALYPADNPLPGGGTAVTDHVVRSSGLHYVEVTSGDGAYQAEFEVYRYGGAAKKQSQTIFLDANGQRLNTGVFGGRGVTTLSRLSKFLSRWGLPASAERAVVDQIKATVRENIESDLKAFGISRYVDVRVVSNYDTRDPFGREGVSRVVVGGTIEESGVPTIGIAQSIDPGNYEREESALVLLDLLSEPVTAEDPAPYSLNAYMNARSNRVAFVGRAIGNVVAHEIGHYIGNWHVDEQNTRANLMDAGGNFPLMFGVGPDGIGGTRDDTDVDFGRDRFNLFEGFTGIEDTMARSAWGLSSRP